MVDLMRYITYKEMRNTPMKNVLKCIMILLIKEYIDKSENDKIK